MLSLPSITAPARHRLAVTVDFVGGREAIEDVRARGGADPLGAEQILDAERDAFQRARLALGFNRSSLAAAISSARSGVLSMKALSASLAASIASICARASSSAEN